MQKNAVIQIILLSLAALSSEVGAKTVCYGDEIGCFSNEPPFHNLPLPQKPEWIQPSVYYYPNDVDFDVTEELLDNPTQFDPDAPVPFDLSKKLIITSAGWNGNISNTSWRKILHHNLLTIEGNSITLIWVNWWGGSRIDAAWAHGDEPSLELDMAALLQSGITQLYTVPASNTRYIGRWVGSKLKKWGADMSNTHCIGFSLGAQVCGMIGQEVIFRGMGKMARISAIDPAAPYFHHVDRAATIDDTDAEFVDVTHCSFVGKKYDIGHMDVYLNNAVFQPGCPFTIPIDGWIETPEDLQDLLITIVTAIDDATSANMTFSDLAVENGGCSHFMCPKAYSDTVLKRIPGCICESSKSYRNGDCCNDYSSSADGGIISSAFDNMRKQCIVNGCRNEETTQYLGYYASKIDNVHQRYQHPTNRQMPFFDYVDGV